jgi:hypothetical protein
MILVVVLPAVYPTGANSHCSRDANCFLRAAKLRIALSNQAKHDE